MSYTTIDIFKRMTQWQRLAVGAGIVGILAILLVIVIPPLTPAHAAGGDWTTYQYNNARTGFNPNETQITPSNAHSLKLHWTHTTGGSISIQPAVANSQVYWGSWDGYEHSTDLNNNKVWTTKLGVTNDSSCNPPSVGVGSSATIATVTINGTATSVDFVGGGLGDFYALNALNGSQIWHTPLGSSPSHFIWSSPAYYNGSVYIGMSSFGDCPLVQGQLIQLNASTGAILHTFNVVPNGCTGGGVWGSPTIDEANNAVYFTTGNPGSCGSGEKYDYSIVKVSASDVSQLISYWQVPANQLGGDSDFGATPTLFTGGGKSLVGAVNKNGVYYTFDRNNIGGGPVWQQRVGNGGDCPQCGTGNVSPSMFDGSTLYIAGGNTTINGASCKGSVNAVNASSGSYIWRHCLNDGPVLGCVTGVPGLVMVTQGRYVMVFAANGGATLFRYLDTNSGSTFYGSVAISGGVMYVGNLDGHLYAIGL